MRPAQLLLLLLLLGAVSAYSPVEERGYGEHR